MPSGFYISQHPLVAHKLSYLRRPKSLTKSKDYVQLMREIGMLLAYEAAQKLQLVDYESDTESGSKKFLQKVSGRKSVIVPIIRSGLVLAEGVREIIASSYTGHIGIHNEKKEESQFKGPQVYFAAMPDDDLSDREIFVVDPVMVTGATAVQAVSILKTIYSVDERKITFITIVATEQAELFFSNKFPHIDVYAAALDKSGENLDVIGDFDTMSKRMYRSS